jgi:hypothetical protein
MTKGRDPLGKQALFSQERTQTRSAARRPGPLDVTVHCSSCDERTTLGAPEIALHHLPVLAWMPWRKHSLFMRCPACNKLSWHAVSRAR